MRKIFFIISIFSFALRVNSQVTLEQTYDSASTYSTNGQHDQLIIINFEVSGERYVKINRHGKKILIYNLSHALLKTIDFSGFPYDSFNANGQDILYLSEKLFDTDPAIEFLFHLDSAGIKYTRVYKEDGSIIFSDTGGVPVRINFPSQQYPIYNTSLGTKMILSYKNGQAKVFGLVGTLSTAIQESNVQLMQTQGISNLYPNPSNGKVTLQYELPNGESGGEIILYNRQGAEVKRYKVDNTFTDLLLDNTMLPAGTYFYQLQTSKGSVGSKKMVVIK